MSQTVIRAEWNVTSYSFLYSTYHEPKYVTAASRIHQHDISKPLLFTEQPCIIHIVPCRQGRACVCVSACVAAGRFLGLVPQSIYPLSFSPRSLHSPPCFLSLALYVSSHWFGACNRLLHWSLCTPRARVWHTAVGRPSSSALMLTLTVQSEAGADTLFWTRACGFAKVKWAGLATHWLLADTGKQKCVVVSVTWKHTALSSIWKEGIKACQNPVFG